MTPYYQDEWATIYHGDCREIMPTLGADVLVSDPPYGIAWKKGLNKAAGSRAHAGIANDGDTSARDWALASVSGKPAVVFGSFYAPFPEDLKQVLVWHKPGDAGLVGSVTGFRRDAEPIFLVGSWPTQTVRWSGVIRSGGGIAATAAATGHPHTKPVALMMRLIEACPPGLIVDPFMGSGSTLVAAKNLGRRCVGIELDRQWCEVAAQRLSQNVLDLGAA